MRFFFSLPQVCLSLLFLCAETRGSFFHNLEIFSVEFRGAERTSRANFPLFKIPQQWSYSLPVFPILHMSGRNLGSRWTEKRPRQEQQQQPGGGGLSCRMSQRCCDAGFFFSLGRLELVSRVSCLASSGPQHAVQGTSTCSWTGESLPSATCFLPQTVCSDWIFSTDAANTQFSPTVSLRCSSVSFSKKPKVTFSLQEDCKVKAK